MAAKTSARVTIKVNGKVRALLSLRSAPQKPLVISMRPATHYVEEGKALTAKSPRIISKKFTVHLSKDSSKNTNCIHHTQRMEGKEISTYNYTQEIKLHNQFAPIFCKRFGDIYGQNFDVRHDNANCIDLGIIDPSRFNLTLMAFVGPPHRELSFASADCSDINTYQWFGHEFSLLFMWSFINCAGIKFGTTVHFDSVPYELWENTDLEDAMRHHVIGHNEKGCLLIFRKSRNDILEELKRLIYFNNLFPSATLPSLFKRLCYFKYPSAILR